MPGMLNIDKDGFGRGNYADLSINGQLAIEPIQDDEQRGENSKLPTHNVYMDAGTGLVLVGAAWTKKVTKPGSPMNGKILYSLELDDPSFPRVLKLTAWPTRDAGHFELRFNRDERQAA